MIIKLNMETVETEKGIFISKKDLIIMLYKCKDIYSIDEIIKGLEQLKITE